MQSHIAGESGDKVIVVEVWESQAAQAEFMNSQLGPAFAEAMCRRPRGWSGYRRGGRSHALRVGSFDSLLASSVMFDILTHTRANGWP